MGEQSIPAERDPAGAAAEPAAAAYFEREGPSRFRATALVGGAWDPDEQHVAPALGLLAHLVETDPATRRDDLRLARASFDILGTLPIDVVDVDVAVVRPGRTIELVEARLGHAGRSAVLLRAWRTRAYDTGALAGTPTARIAPPGSMGAWDPASTWPGEFVRSVQVRRAEVEPGRAACWVRTRVPLLAGEPVSATARALGLVDLANGMAVRAAARDVAFPNLDLTVHLVDQPLLDQPPSEQGGWLGLDTSVSFGPGGLGLTHSTLHDARGPFGTLAQCLTVRPRAR